jgi:hypothetical protein
MNDTNLIIVVALQSIMILSLLGTLIWICAIGLIALIDLSEAKHRAPSAKQSPFRPGSAPVIHAGGATGGRGGCSGPIFEDVEGKRRWMRRVMADAPRNADGTVKWRFLS